MSTEYTQKLIGNFRQKYYSADMSVISAENKLSCRGEKILFEISVF